MKLINWIEFINPNINVIIFVDNEQEARYEGLLLNMPWYLINYEIGRNNEDEDEPIIISCKENVIIINLISPESI